MTYYNPNADTIREEIFSVANNDGEGGLFLSNFYGKTLDGSDVAEYLESIGFTVVDYHDTGRNGLVTLSNGVEVSTNGYCLRKASVWKVEIARSYGKLVYTVIARTRQDAECRAVNDHMAIHGYRHEYKITATYEVPQ